MPIVKSFAAFETLAFHLPNVDYGGHSPSVATKLVREGLGRWAWCNGGTLAFVPMNYKLKANEWFLRETSSGLEVEETA